MSTPTPASISQRLTTTSSLLLERSRIITLKLKPSPSSTSQIIRNLTALRSDLDQLELESKGLSVGGRNKGKSSANGTGIGRDGDADGEGDDQVRELGERYDRLLEMLGEDDVGREKAKALRREMREPTPPPASTSQTPISVQTSASASVSSPGSEVPRLSIEPPTPGADVRFRDFPEGDEDELESRASGRGNVRNGSVNGNGSGSGGGGGKERANPFASYRDGSDDEHSEGDGVDHRDMLNNQQTMMDDQDERLNLLSHSIGRQNHLSIQIGSELDIHHQLLEDTDAAMDRTSASLSRARRRLDRVADEAKAHGSTITIVVLIFILLILIIVFKT